MATTTQINNFITLIAPLVQAECKKRGWGVPSAIIGQACLESAYGTSSLWTSCYNGFGMKYSIGCGTDYKSYQTNEQRADGSYYTVTSKFRKYPNINSGIEGYFNFIESYSRYKPVRAVAFGDYKSYATQLKDCGWATSLAYTKNIISVVEKYGLTKYDVEVVTTTTQVNPFKEPILNIKNGSKGEGAKWVQFELNKHGANLVVDGIFGTKSVAALKNFQKKAFPNEPKQWDGICGKGTRAKLKAN